MEWPFLTRRGCLLPRPAPARTKAMLQSLQSQRDRLSPSEHWVWRIEKTSCDAGKNARRLQPPKRARGRSARSTMCGLLGLFRLSIASIIPSMLPKLTSVPGTMRTFLPGKISTMSPLGTRARHVTCERFCKPFTLGFVEWELTIATGPPGGILCNPGRSELLKIAPCGSLTARPPDRCNRKISSFLEDFISAGRTA